MQQLRDPTAAGPRPTPIHAGARPADRVPAAHEANGSSGRLAFLFPGQGSQRVGMGDALRATDPHILEAHLARADALAGRSVSQACAHGPLGVLTSTDVAQPALFAISMAVHEVARELGLRPGAVAGHSLGEYSAAVAAGALPIEHGARLVTERGRLMAGAQAQRPGAMAAIVGIDGEAAARLCAQMGDTAVLTPANINAPSQVVVSGDVSAIEAIIGLVTERGSGRAVRLPVGAAFHSPLMIPVRQRLDALTEDLPWRDPDVPLIANASGHAVCTAAGVRHALVAQVAAPVRWVDCIEWLVSAGYRHFLELGPGRVLSGLVRQIAPDADVAAVDSRGALETYVAQRPALVR